MLLLVMTGAAGAALMTSVRLTAVVPPALVAESVTGKEPVSVGVPEMIPVTGAKDRPAGSVPVSA